jgi:hypothetical protein
VGNGAVHPVPAWGMGRCTRFRRGEWGGAPGSGVHRASNLDRAPRFGAHSGLSARSAPNHLRPPGFGAWCTPRTPDPQATLVPHPFIARSSPRKHASGAASGGTGTKCRPRTADPPTPAVRRNIGRPAPVPPPDDTVEQRARAARPAGVQQLRPAAHIGFQQAPRQPKRHLGAELGRSHGPDADPGRPAALGEPAHERRLADARRPLHDRHAALPAGPHCMTRSSREHSSSLSTSPICGHDGNRWTRKLRGSP